MRQEDDLRAAMQLLEADPPSVEDVMDVVRPASAKRRRIGWILPVAAVAITLAVVLTVTALVSHSRPEQGPPLGGAPPSVSSALVGVHWTLLSYQSAGAAPVAGESCVVRPRQRSDHRAIRMRGLDGPAAARKRSCRRPHRRELFERRLRGRRDEREQGGVCGQGRPQWASAVVSSRRSAHHLEAWRRLAELPAGGCCRDDQRPVACGRRTCGRPAASARRNGDDRGRRWRSWQCSGGGRRFRRPVFGCGRARQLSGPRH